jgi:hypothetical protein
VNSLVETPLKLRSYNTLWLLIALFAIPPVAAWLFYFNPQWLPEARSNHGRLIEPPRPVDSLHLLTPAGAPFNWQKLQAHWTLTLVREGGCDAACIEVLIEARQIRRATGANRQQIERLLILLPDRQGLLDPPDLAGLEGTILAIADSDQRQALLAIFPVDPSVQSIPLFLIDPRLDLMMTHDTSLIPAKQILQDVEMLLKVSQSWVKGGQYGHK